MKTHGTDNLGFLVHDVARLLRRRFELRSGEVGLSAAQWRLLFRVAKEEGLPQARLAELLEIEPISVSRMLDRMEDADWIERRPDGDDRRVRRVYLTARAQAVYERVRGMAHEVYGEALAGVCDADRAALIRTLETISMNLADGETVCGADSKAMDEKAAVK